MNASPRLATFIDSVFDFAEQTMMKKTAIVLAASAATGKAGGDHDWWSHDHHHLSGCAGCCDKNEILRQHAKLTTNLMESQSGLTLAELDDLILLEENANAYVKSVNNVCNGTAAGDGGFLLELFGLPCEYYDVPRCGEQEYYNQTARCELSGADCVDAPVVN